MNDPRGSIWRKWDLHLHTPASVLNWKGTALYRHMDSQQQRDSVTREIIKFMESLDVAVFGIMDYWTFDGYFEIANLLSRDSSLSFTKTIFPGIELRIEAPTNFRLNFHVLFSNEVTQQQLHDFKSQLKIRTKSRKLSLSDEALVETAKSLDTSKAQKRGYDDPTNLDEKKLLKLGAETAEITKDSLETALQEIRRELYLIILPYDTYGGLEKLNWEQHPLADNYFMQFADIFEARHEDNINLFLGIETLKNKDFLANFMKTIGGKPKLPISGSDAHRITDIGNFPNNKITWIKADPTFEGLNHVLVDPRARSFMGGKPPELQKCELDRNRYIESVKIVKKGSQYKEEIWFDDEIEFNAGLVAIIGNKGMGKSAIADIVGLLGGTHRNQKLFSFLNEFKFCQPPAVKAKYFDAELHWKNGSIDKRNLNDFRNANVEKVRFVPQHFFEAICNETEAGGEFDKELKKVIFSHVKEYARLGCQTLDELTTKKTNEIEANIAVIKTKIEDISSQIVELEEKTSKTSKAILQTQLNDKERELKLHLENKPTEVKKPAEDSKTSQEITKLTEEVSTHESGLSTKREKMKQNESRLVVVERLLTAIEGFRYQFLSLKEEHADDLKEIGLKFEDIIKVEIDTSILDSQELDVRSSLNTDEKEIKLTESKITDLGENIEKLKNTLKQSELKYQNYLSDLRKWETKKTELVGNSTRDGSIENLKKRLTDIEDLVPKQLQLKKTKRTKLIKEIYQRIGHLSNVFSSLYKPVKEFIMNHSLVKDKYKLQFDVSIDISNDFVDDFFSFIRHDVVGNFQGIKEGRKRLADLICNYDFNEKKNVIEFVDKLIAELTTISRLGKTELLDIKEQLRKEKEPTHFLDFLYSLDYLRPNYSLKFDDKNLSGLSPGERGTLLLIFYLLIDNDECPLILDQPEENLDNQSIYELLVPCVKEAKQKRQIFMVTHNPNLAVVCNSDQIIYTHIDKSNKNEFSHVSGAIENPDMNKKIVDVLEGTWPALETREAMYQRNN